MWFSEHGWALNLLVDGKMANELQFCWMQPNTQWREGGTEGGREELNYSPIWQFGRNSVNSDSNSESEVCWQMEWKMVALHLNTRKGYLNKQTKTKIGIGKGMDNGKDASHKTACNTGCRLKYFPHWWAKQLHLLISKLKFCSPRRKTLLFSSLDLYFIVLTEIRRQNLTE